MTRSLTLLSCLALAVVAAPAQAERFGPDAEGYSAIDNVGEPGGPVFAFEDISTTGISLVVGDDVVSLPQSLSGPHLPFILYGLDYNKFVASTNGFLSFDIDSGADPSNDCPLPVPVAGDGARIMVLHDDLLADHVWYQAFASSPVPHPSAGAIPAMIVQWDVEHFPAGASFSVQAVLYSNDHILLQYQAGNPERGLGSTTGVQSAFATSGLTIHCRTHDSIPDGYAVLIKPFPDCNNNFVDDAEDIASGTSLDCNRNDIPDECDVDPADPDNNGEVSPDCNLDIVPDECQTDCNGNGIPDDCDIASGFSLDCNLNGIPDECEIDCNRDGIPDDCDIASGFSTDCNGNDIPDECDIATGFATDCNGSGLPDHCEISETSPAPGGPFFCTANCDPDCNGNGIPDDCDVDCNENGVPDDCDTAPEYDPLVAVPRDDCPDAENLGNRIIYIGNSIGATADGPPACGSAFGLRDVWYRYRPAYDGLVFVGVLGSALFETQAMPLVFGVLDGCPADGGMLIACNSVNPVGTSFDGVKGHEYWIRIAAPGLAEAAFTVRLTAPRELLNPTDANANRIPDVCECLSDVNDDGVVDALDFALVMAAFGPCAGCPEDIDGSGVVDDVDAQQVLIDMGPCPFP